MILARIQENLCALYQLPLSENVESFLLSSFLPPPLVGEGEMRMIHHSFGQEALIVKENKGNIEVGLYLEPSLLKNLEQNDPFNRLTEKNFHDFCVAIEGVSHWTYFLFRAAQGLPVTELELELQADIDRFLLLCFLFHKSHEMIPQELIRRLFDQVTFKKNLTAKTKARYVQANSWAYKFCSRLLEESLKNGCWIATLRLAREFYQKNHWEKIRYLTP